MEWLSSAEKGGLPFSGGLMNPVVRNGGQNAGKYCAKLKYHGGISPTLPG